MKNKEDIIPYSDCCGAETCDTEMGICPDCLEYCEFTYEDDEEESFDRPKPKDFTMKLEFSSNKPNKITYGSRDNTDNK